MNDINKSKCQTFLDPEDMTPEEQTQRIVEILAAACVRWAMEEKEKAKTLPENNGVDFLTKRR